MWRYAVEGFELEKRVYFAYRHNTVHVRYRLTTGAGRVRLKLKPAVHFRGHDDHVSGAPCAPVRAHRRRGPVRADVRHVPDPPHGGRGRREQRVHRPRRAGGRRGVPDRGVARVRVPGRAVRAGPLPARPGAGARCHARLLDRAVGADPGGAPGRGARGRTRAPAAAGRAGRPGRARRVRGRTGAGRRPVRLHPGGPRRGRGPRPRAGRRGPLGHRRLPLVHRLGPRHDDFAGGADAHHGAIRRGRVHPPHVRPARPGRADPQPVPRKRTTRGCTTPPTRPCGSSTRCSGTWATPATATTLRQLLPKLQDIVAPPRPRHPVRHRRGPGRRPAAAGGGGLPAHLDGREGGRLGGDPAARQGGRDQRAVVQRPAPARGMAARGGRRGGGRAGRPRGARAGSRSTAGSGTSRAGTCTTCSTGRAGTTTRPCARTRCSPSRSTTRCWTRPGGRRCWTWCASRLLTPVGLRSLAPGHPDYKPKYFGDLRARDAAYHQGTVWGWLIGPFVDAWAEGSPGRTGPARRRCSTGSAGTWARRASARSARCSTPSRRTPRAACVAQAWSVAEVLRCLVKTAG